MIIDKIRPLHGWQVIAFIQCLCPTHIEDVCGQNKPFLCTFVTDVSILIMKLKTKAIIKIISR